MEVGRGDLLPSIRAIVNLAKSSLQGAKGDEEAIYRKSNYHHFEASVGVDRYLVKLALLRQSALYP